MGTAAELFASGIEYHQVGQLQAAEKLYRQVLAIDPNHCDALHLLGVIAHQVGNQVVAIDLISRSIDLKGDEAHAHNNLGAAYRAMGRFPESADCFRRALQLQPDDPATLVNLGNVLRDQGRPDDAVACFRRAIESTPDFVSAHTNLGDTLRSRGELDQAIACYRRVLVLKSDEHEVRINLGNTLKEQGRVADAIACYRQSIELQPHFLAAYINLGVALKEQGQSDDAIACYQQALTHNPHFAEAHNNLGIALKDHGQLYQAVNHFRRALDLRPGYADAHNNLGNAFSDQGKIDEAIACFRRALDLQPNFALAHNNLGVALKERGRLEEAIASFRRAQEFDPASAEVYNNMSVALKTLGKLDEALACCRRALELHPAYAEAHNNLGNVLKDQGRLDDAIDCYRRAVELKPDFAIAHSNLIYAQLFCPGLDGPTLLQEHLRWNASHAAGFAKRIQAWPNNRSRDRRLRIGYVSPDFRNHVVGRNLIPLFREHDHDQFEIFCYSDVPAADDLTRRFQEYAVHWRVAAGQTDEQLTAAVRADQIDILVDLALHMARNRLPVFARKPAPIQVTFAGYPGTTGLSTIDYRLTDSFLDPPGLNDAFYTEKSFRLRDSFWCYDPLGSEQQINPLPALSKSYITFGCLNNFCKVNPPVLKLWARVLHAVENSRLMILAGEGEHRMTAVKILTVEGIASDRVTFVPNQPRQQYLQSYHDVDIGLDTAPYNGHTTSLDSFWMGVPVITLVGQTVAGRAGLCQLMNLDLPELIAYEPEQFVRIAVELASDLPRLSRLRSALRDRMQASPLMNAPRFAHSIEAAYTEIWQSWIDDQ